MRKKITSNIIKASRLPSRSIMKRKMAPEENAPTELKE
jgi:hypothetical protein